LDVSAIYNFRASPAALTQKKEESQWNSARAFSEYIDDMLDEKIFTAPTVDISTVGDTTEDDRITESQNPQYKDPSELTTLVAVDKNSIGKCTSSLQETDMLGFTDIRDYFNYCAQQRKNYINALVVSGQVASENAWYKDANYGTTGILCYLH